MGWLLPLLAGTATGILSGFGVGGGTLLLIYMTTFAGVPQNLAQGVNLLYFLPAAATALPGRAPPWPPGWPPGWTWSCSAAASAASSSWWACGNCSPKRDGNEHEKFHGCSGCGASASAPGSRRPGGRTRYSAAAIGACRVIPMRAARGAAAPVV